MLATSSATWWMTRGGEGGTSGAGAPATVVAQGVPSTPSTPVATPADADASPDATGEAMRPVSPATTTSGSRALPAVVRGPAPDVRPASREAATYDRDVAALRTIVTQRRSELDSATVAVLERNLAIIDAAIAESRAALSRDPRSPVVGDQLQRALARKVELLRTIATLPRA
jgi:hypothetical protein